MRAEYDQRGAAVSPAVHGFVDAYLVARELGSTARRGARPRRSIAPSPRLRRVGADLRGRPEPQVIWGSLLAERYLEDGDFAAAQKANVHFLLGARARRQERALPLAGAVADLDPAVARRQPPHRARLPRRSRQAAVRRRRGRAGAPADAGAHLPPHRPHGRRRRRRRPGAGDGRPLARSSRPIASWRSIARPCATSPPAASSARWRSTTISCPRSTATATRRRRRATGWSRGWRAPAPRSAPGRSGGRSPISTSSTRASPTPRCSRDCSGRTTRRRRPCTVTG